jgi:hypothetical protein
MSLRALAVILALALAACGENAEDRRAETLASDAVITPGVYSNVTDHPESGDLTGMEISLAQGSDSRTVSLVDCRGGCERVPDLPARRGLGGIAFAYPRYDRSIDVTVQPDGPDAVTLGADWGNGFEQRRLVRTEEAIGAAITQRP